MTKLQKAVVSALCLTFLFSAFFSPADKEDIQKYSMFFPGFSFRIFNYIKQRKGKSFNY